MSNPQAAIHLKRASDLLNQVELKTDDLQRQAAAHSAALDQDRPFLAGMASSFLGARALSGEKAKLLSDVQLASSEIDRAAALDPDVSVDTPHGPATATGLRCVCLLLRGSIELIYGTNEAAKVLFQQSLQVAETADAYYMLGLIHEAEYKPAEALEQFEKYLALDPNGEFSVNALREADKMRNYKVGFRGSWGTFALLILFCFPAAPIYYFVKRK